MIQITSDAVPACTDDGGASPGSSRLRAALLQGAWVLDGKTGDAERRVRSRNSVQKLPPADRLAAIKDDFGHHTVEDADILNRICAAMNGESRESPTGSGKDGSGKEEELLKVAKRTGFTRGKWVIFAGSHETEQGLGNKPRRKNKRGGKGRHRGFGGVM